MKPIGKLISRPYLRLIIAMPLAIMLLFNIIVLDYSQKQGKKTLMQAIETIQESIGEKGVPSLMSLVQNQYMSDSVDLIVYMKNGKVSRLFNHKSSFVSDEIANIAYDKTSGLSQNEIGSFRFRGNTYYVVTMDYRTMTSADRLVYISKGLAMDDFTNTINLVLMGISVFITLIAVFVSKKVTNSIARPIERVTGLVEHMKTDEILVIDDKCDSLEFSKLIDEINSLNHRIYQYDQAQKNFLHNASHELRTPLMSIQGYADGIEMGVFKDYKGTAHLISDQCKHLTKLVESLLKLARAENFNTSKKLERLNLSDSLLELINGYNGYAISQNIKMKIDVPPNIFTNANTELLQGSVGNMISNAIRYAKTTVTVSLERQDKKAIITVRDDGNGVKDLDKIFERFSKGEDGNFGLGLAIAKTSVDVMGGKISVYNDGGAVFVISMDIA